MKNYLTPLKKGLTDRLKRLTDRETARVCVCVCEHMCGRECDHNLTMAVRYTAIPAAHLNRINRTNFWVEERKNELLGLFRSDSIFMT